MGSTVTGMNNRPLFGSEASRHPFQKGSKFFILDPSDMVYILKRKNMLPRGKPLSGREANRPFCRNEANCFILDHFSDGRQNYFAMIGSFERVSREVVNP